MSHEEIARQTAQRLKLLDPSGELILLDSLMIVDYAIQLERDTGYQIPTSEFREASFNSLAAVVKMLERVSPSK